MVGLTLGQVTCLCSIYAEGNKKTTKSKYYLYCYFPPFSQLTVELFDFFYFYRMLRMTEVLRLSTLGRPVKLGDIYDSTTDAITDSGIKANIISP